ncbi:MAG TPA: rhodanese-like domain-containing protein, partial [Bacteroidia bacterium]|nr:rhodanese-like domain-containing protein [Bacteroidia bacterium]
NIGKETYSTLGEQKKTNHALQDMPREEFIAKLTDGIAPAPAYFFKDATMNRAGYVPVEEVITKGLTPLTVENFETAMNNGAVVIDSRLPASFELGFIPKSINVGIDGQFAIWSATLVDIKAPVLLICDEGRETEAATRLARTGFENLVGLLKGGFDAWRKAGKEIDMVVSVEPDELEMDYKHGKITVLDIRKEGEYDDGHVKDAKWITLQDLEKNLDKLDKDEDIYVHCAGGYRSMMGASILKANGFERVRNVYGGYGKIKETTIPLEVKKAATR